MMDLLDFADYETSKADVKAAFDRVDDDIKLAVCREIMIDQICGIIDKFPVHTQREIIALLTDRYMRQWQTLDKGNQL